MLAKDRAAEMRATQKVALLATEIETSVGPELAKLPPKKSSCSEAVPVSLLSRGLFRLIWAHQVTCKSFRMPREVIYHRRMCREIRAHVGQEKKKWSPLDRVLGAKLRPLG